MWARCVSLPVCVCVWLECTWVCARDSTGFTCHHVFAAVKTGWVRGAANKREEWEVNVHYSEEQEEVEVEEEENLQAENFILPYCVFASVNQYDK